MAPAAIDVELEGVTDVTSLQLPDPLSLDMIPERRLKSAKMSSAIASFSNADMFKSPGSLLKAKSKRWDYRISEESKARHPSRLKGAAFFLKDPNVISLGGGLPSSDYFPFDHFDITVPNGPSFRADSSTHRIGKHDVRDGKSIFDFHIGLNYAQSMGSPQLLRFLVEHTEMIHNPPYADWDCCMDVGSTSGLDICLRMLCEKGHFVLTEEYTFSSAVDTMIPMGLKVVGVGMDDEGMRPDSLDEILSHWDPVSRGGPKPFVMYTVPTGQNPTGATQGTERRKAIMALAEKHDLMILEDEPYYFLQMQRYHSAYETQSNGHTNGHANGASSPVPNDHKAFLSSLVPSYLSLDRSGRVLRLDSFSKVIAPGTRTGWITGPAQLIERFVRHSEVSVQTASGISQVILYKLLDEAWGHTGYLDWLIHLRKEYTNRRNVIMRAVEHHLGLYQSRGIVSWTAPMAGMFFWIHVDHTKHPLFSALTSNSPPQTTASILQQIEYQIFTTGVQKYGVLVGRGSWFRAECDTDEKLFFRMTFAAASEEKIEEAVGRFAAALREEFGELLEGEDKGVEVMVNGNGNGIVHGH